MNDNFWDWLTNLDKYYASEGVELKKRPWSALELISKAKNMAKTGQDSQKAFPLNLAGVDCHDIFAWYARKYPQQISFPPNQILPFFHNGFFWRIEISMILGKPNDVPIDDIIRSIPESEFKDLERTNLDGYHYFWADCVDYLFGYDNILKIKQFKLGKNLLIAADEHLKTAVCALLQSPPLGKMVQQSILAVEMYLKGFLCIKKSLTEKQLKNYGHKLDKLIDECLEIVPSSRLKHTKQSIVNLMPSVNERYVPSKDTPFKLWEIYRRTQFVAAEIMRLLSGIDNRKNMESHFPDYAAREFINSPARS